MKKLKEYLPFLLGNKVRIEKEWIYEAGGFMEKPVKEPVVTFNADLLCKAEADLIIFKPLLKPLSSMTERNRFELDVHMHRAAKNTPTGALAVVYERAIVTKWYLENSFDIFDLIGKDLAIDTTLNSEPKPKLTYEKD